MTEPETHFCEGNTLPVCTVVAVYWEEVGWAGRRWGNWTPVTGEKKHRSQRGLRKGPRIRSDISGHVKESSSRSVWWWGGGGELTVAK